jgi:hypothetical protein
MLLYRPLQILYELFCQQFGPVDYDCWRSALGDLFPRSIGKETVNGHEIEVLYDDGVELQETLSDLADNFYITLHD